MEWPSKVIGATSIIGAVISFIMSLFGLGKELNPIIAIVFIGAIIFFAVSYISEDMEKNEERLKKLEENLNIHQQLVDIKAKLQVLEKGKKWNK